MWEHTDAGRVKDLAQKLKAAKLDIVLTQRTKQGGVSYEVSAGPYAAKQAAAAALSELSALPAVADVAKDYRSSVTGPLHWRAGAYASVEEAAAQAAIIERAGFEADVAAFEAAGAPEYGVLVASAADQAELDAVKQQLTAAIPGLALQPVPREQSYALFLTELVQAQEGAPSNGGDDTRQRLMLGGTNAKLQMSPASSGTIKVLERYERSYRGTLELSQLNGEMALINELPLEEYLVSVVSAELNENWPLEALKAQAVAARTYALKQGLKYQIAHVTDTTLDQVYKGVELEFPSAVTAVTATQGEVLADQAGLITPLFYSNAGGMTAESTEVWGNRVSYFKSAESPDEGAQQGKAVWYRIVLPNGSTGYIHSTYAKDTGDKNNAGFSVYEATDTGVAVRSAPYVDNAANPALFKVNIGDRFVVFDQAVESNAYSWLRGPYEGDQLKDKINAVLEQPITGSLERLEVSAKGVSGRVTEVQANGQVLKPASPDALRTVFNSLPSTRFEIEETGSYTVLGADGVVRSQTPASPRISIVDGSGQAKDAAGEQLFIMDGNSKVKMKDGTTRFIFKGSGFGHGLGMSQWGARGLAERGYDYKKILETYYHGVSIIKE
ncbi:stage II sporulation protein SpoIID [Paenibacillus xerothermodurans]|uniref:Stage II sporulation protein SpoIID n=1 Tax=Paenibacillus xerothermodurans TaxID=1977292 RepID=A0A2W1N6V0_PAEXE|nr:stage II sporulation protein SpoIID [Paenibacillus xerothermodurans]